MNSISSEMNSKPTEVPSFYLGGERNEAGKSSMCHTNNDQYLPVSLKSDEENETVPHVAANEKLNFTINLCGTYKISIYKPLIPLKLVLFCWFGAGSFFTPFITVYFKQHGITLAQLSTAYIIAPAAQFGGTLLSGVIADKIGRAKPVLISNLVLTVLMLICILSIPLTNVTCNKQSRRLSCPSQLLEHSFENSKCDIVEIKLDTNSCDLQWFENNATCCNQTGSGSLELQRENFCLLYNSLNESNLTNELCFSQNHTLCRCVQFDFSNYSALCNSDSENECSKESPNSILNMVTMLFYMFLMVAYSNCYRFLDVTAMFLVEEHKSDFGRERFFSIFGNLIISPIAGYIVSATTSEGEEKNYLPAFYLFIALIIFILIIIYKLEVRIKAPGKKMVKKSIILMKNLDVLSFAFVVFILGTAWSFTTKFLFWHLEEIQTPSVLIGLIPAAGALYGLPFLYTSGWWMMRIGTTQMFVLGLLGYVIYGLGYSFLTNPWISLVIEATTVITYHLLWVAVVLRSHELAPEGLSATVISIAGSIHYHIGKSSGSLIGGLIMSQYGGRVAFQVIAIVCFVSAIFYSLFLYFKYRKSKRLTTKHNEQFNENINRNEELQTL